MPLLVDVEAQLLAVKLHRSVLEPLFAQLLCQAVELYEQVGVLALVALGSGSGCWLSCAVDHAVLLQQLLHLLVAVAAVGAYDGVHDAEVFNLSIVVEVEDHAEGELVFIGSQRADKVAEALGQHGYGPVDEIYARGTFHRLAVNDRAFLHIVAHVGNVDTYLPQALAQLLYGQGVVKVFGVVRVYGAGERLAEIFAFSLVLRRDLAGDLVGGLLHVLRILVRQAILCEDGVHLHIVVACRSEHVDDLAHDVLVVRVGPLCDLYHRLVARLSALQLLLGYYDVAGVERSRCHEKRQLLLHAQLAHERVFGVFQHLNDLCLLYVVLSSRHDRHLHAVTAERRHRVALRHEEGRRAVVGCEGVLAVGFALEPSLHDLSVVVETIRVVADLREKVVPCHLLHEVDGEHFQGVRVKMQRAEYLFERRRPFTALCEKLDQFFRHLFLSEALACFLSFCHSGMLLR